VAKRAAAGLLLSLIWAAPLAAQSRDLAVRKLVAPFTDELPAMKKLEGEPNEANAKALAAIRFRHAVKFARLSEQDTEGAAELALFYAESATRLDPDAAGHWDLTGRLYAKMQGHAAARFMAEECLSQAVRLDPENDRTRLALGQLLFSQERYHAALAQFEIVMSRDPAAVTATAAAAMGSAYLLDRQYSRGVAFFRAILAKRPDADSVRLALAVLLRQQKNLDEAKSELRGVAERRSASDRNREYAEKLLEEWKTKDETE